MLKITIHAPDADWTPSGKRGARIIQTTGRFGTGRQLRWYVSGKIYRRLNPNAANIAMTGEWLSA